MRDGDEAKWRACNLNPTLLEPVAGHGLVSGSLAILAWQPEPV